MGLFGATAQGQSAEETARAAYETLRTDGVVIRVPTRTAKITAMEDLLADGNLSTANHARLERRLVELREETRAYNHLLMGLFREIYATGPLYFVPDTAMHTLLDGERRGLTLTDELELDPASVLPDHFLILRIDYTDASQQARAEGFIFSDDQMADLAAPFPVATVFNNAWYALNQLLAPGKADEIRLRKTIERIQQRLERFGGE
ncbi:MAG: hypothetical protein KDC54_21795 [Lewinella sp.]|nr:hypothetical protein [Lewinella sp.]